MKTLRMLSTWLMVLVCLSLTTTACSDDDDEEDLSGSIIGTWQHENDEYIEIMTFNSDGTVQMTIKTYYNGQWNSITAPGIYTYEKNIITIKMDGAEQVIRGIVKSLTATSLTIGNEEEGLTETTYKKV